jgi:hypothetical protein
MSKRKAEAPDVPRIIITVRGGVADIVCKPAGVEVCIIDYDVDGEDERDAARDADGRPCRIWQEDAGAQILSQEHWPLVRTAARRIAVHRKQRWQCPDCRRIVGCSEASLVEAGTPFCPDCERHLQLL